MPKYLRIAILFFITSLFNCTNKDQGQSVLAVDIKRNDSLRYQDLFSKITLVPLETTPESVLNLIVKMDYIHDRYFILDRKREAIFIFTKDGKFVKKVQKNSHSTAVYETFNDFNVNPFTNELEILNPHGIIYRYALDANLTYIGEYIVDLGDIKVAHYFTNLSKDIIAFYSVFNNNRLVYYSKIKKGVIKTDINVPDFVSRKTLFNSIYSPFVKVSNNPNDLVLFDVFTNDIYKFKGDEKFLKYKWDFGEYNFDLAKDIKPDQEFSYYIDFQKADTTHAFNFRCYMENQKYIFTSLTFKGLKTIVFDKKSRTYKVIPQEAQLKINSNSIITEKCIYSVVDANKAGNYLAADLIDKNKFKNLQNSNNSDNPVILIYSFK